MKKRSFLKSLLLIIGSFPLKIFSYQNKENITFDYGVASGDPTNSHIILWTKISKENNEIVLNTIPNRLKFFDEQNFDMYPLVPRE